jgi:hypothetical protein
VVRMLPLRLKIMQNYRLRLAKPRKVKERAMRPIVKVMERAQEISIRKRSQSQRERRLQNINVVELMRH